MERLGQAFVVPVLAIVATLALAGAQQESKDTKVAPAEAYRALLAEFQQTARGLYEATTDEQRSAVAERMAGLSVRTLDWAEHNATDPLARECLVQVVVQEIWLENNSSHPGRVGDSLEDRAIALLAPHVDSAAIGEACTRMSYGFRRSCETFLRAVLARNPDHEVQGLACLRLAYFLNGRQRRLDLLAVRPEMAARYEGLFGVAYLGELRQQDRTAALAEVEAIFERVAREFGDTKLPYGRTAGEVATSELHELRHLSVGKQALELEGLDQDGAAIKLGDYRGKVVLLYFWTDN